MLQSRYFLSQILDAGDEAGFFFVVLSFLLPLFIALFPLRHLAIAIGTQLFLQHPQPSPAHSSISATTNYFYEWERD